MLLFGFQEFGENMTKICDAALIDEVIINDKKGNY